MGTRGGCTRPRARARIGVRTKLVPEQILEEAVLGLGLGQGLG